MNPDKSTHWSDAFFHSISAVYAVDQCMEKQATEAEITAALERIADEFIADTQCPFGRAWLVREFLDRME
jgi:hypothetical protein